MLVPHLHLGGRCEEAIELYKKAFDATVDSVLYSRDMGGGEGVGHAEMYIHGQRVMLNDRFGNTKNSMDSAIQIVMIFSDVDELKRSYSVMREGSTTIDAMGETFYSPCVVVFMDKFGVQWCFMVDENHGR